MHCLYERIFYRLMYELDKEHGELADSIYVGNRLWRSAEISLSLATDSSSSWLSQAKCWIESWDTFPGVSIQWENESKHSDPVDILYYLSLFSHLIFFGHYKHLLTRRWRQGHKLTVLKSLYSCSLSLCCFFKLHSLWRERISISPLEHFRLNC